MKKLGTGQMDPEWTTINGITTSLTTMVIMRIVYSSGTMKNGAIQIV
jgi:hypothetical protein